jgi:hypothetical protein
MSDAADFVDDLLTFLCQAPRTAGSPRNGAVAGHLRRLYDAMGYRTSVHKFEFVGWEQLEPPRVRYLHPIQQDLDDCLSVVWSLPTDGPVTGRIKPVVGFPSVVHTFEEYPWFTFPVVDERGSVVACLLSNAEVWPQPLHDETNPMPTVMVGASEYHRLTGWRKRGIEPAVEVSLASRFLDGRTGRNVVAAAGDRPAVLVCAHYDSFFTTTGAHDNASGTAALLELARRFGPNARGDVAFVSFDAEEWNKLGSYRFVDALQARGELSTVRAMINIDSVGVGEGVYLLTSRGLAEPIRRALERAEAESPRHSGRPISVHESDAFKMFDTWPFMRRGIPVVQIGTFGEPFRYWHRPEDRLSLIGRTGRASIADVVAVVTDLLRFWLPPGSAAVR